MSYFPDLGADGTLLDLFKRFPSRVGPLLEYHQQLLRGPSGFSVAQREWMAAYVSAINACGYCHGVHAAVAERFGIEAGVLTEAVADPHAPAVPEAMRPVLAFLKKQTQSPSRLTAADAQAVRDAGWTDDDLFDAISVGALFNLMNRMVEGAGIEANPGYHAVSAERLASGGYEAIRGLVEQNG